MIVPVGLRSKGLYLGMRVLGVGFAMSCIGGGRGNIGEGGSTISSIMSSGVAPVWTVIDRGLLASLPLVSENSSSKGSGSPKMSPSSMRSSSLESSSNSCSLLLLLLIAS
jgi:hypothetical protein